MKVEILYFAQLREAMGVDSEVVDAAPRSTVGDVVARLQERRNWNAVRALPLSYAVNESVVDREQPLHEGDRLALLPPVSGG